MKIAIGSDHRGFEVKRKIVELVTKLGHEAIDCGATDCSAIDYPDIATDVNVMCLSADLLGERLIDRMVELWINTEFEKGRHQRRVDKICDIEKRFAKEDQ